MRGRPRNNVASKLARQGFFGDRRPQPQEVVRRGILAPRGWRPPDVAVDVQPLGGPRNLRGRDEEHFGK